MTGYAELLETLQFEPGTDSPFKCDHPESITHRLWLSFLAGTEAAAMDQGLEAVTDVKMVIAGSIEIQTFKQAQRQLVMFQFKPASSD